MDDEEQPPLLKREEEEGEDAVFDWAEYLERTRAQKAPRSAFYQPQDVPQNALKVGQLILAKDDQAHLMVLSRIDRVHECWIYTYIEGLELSRRGRWFICDDRDIAPVAPKNANLKVDNRGAYPPTGLKHYFKRWIVQQFEGQEGSIAEASQFKTIGVDKFPKGNLFEVGMKLAAFRQERFDGKLSPATVVAVNKEKIRLNFDGWPSSYDITVPFYSRCLFPIDFVEGAGLAVEIPPLPEPAENAKEGAVGQGLLCQSTLATHSPVADNENNNDDTPLSKRKRMGFFDESTKPMRPAQRTAALKEQITGVKAKVIDLLRKATEEQEKNDEMQSRLRVSAKLAYSIVNNSAEDEADHATPIRLPSDDSQRPAAAPMSVSRIVFKNPNSEAIYPTRQNQPPVSNGPRTVVPYSLVDPRLRSPAVTVSTPSGVFVKAAPHIIPALRATIVSQSAAGPPPTAAGSSQENVPVKRRPSVAELVAQRTAAVAQRPTSGTKPLVQKPRVWNKQYNRETKTVEKFLDDAIVKMYVNKGCNSGPMLDSAKVAELHDYNPLPYHAQMTRIVQDIIYCAWVPKEVFGMVQDVGPLVPGMKITLMHGSEILTKTIPIPPSVVSAVLWLRDFLTSLNCCPHLFSPSELSCESCDSEEKQPRPSAMPTALERAPKYKREFDVLLKLGARMGGCLQVARDFRQRLGDDAAEMILDNKIDFSVLPFCQEDLLREQMKLPYNTALRMAAVACQLRAAAFESVPGIDQMDLQLK